MKKSNSRSKRRNKRRKEIKAVRNFIKKTNKYTIENTYKKNKISTKNIDKALNNYSIGEAGLSSVNDNYNKFKDDIKEFVVAMRKKNPDNISAKQSKLLDYWYELNVLVEYLDAQKGKGLRILTKQQMLNRLPISLAQIQARNNSIKSKNEIRQLMYSLYRSKVLTKTVYNNLIKII